MKENKFTTGGSLREQKNASGNGFNFKEGEFFVGYLDL